MTKLKQLMKKDKNFLSYSAYKKEGTKISSLDNTIDVFFLKILKCIEKLVTCYLLLFKIFLPLKQTLNCYVLKNNNNNCLFNIFKIRFANVIILCDSLTLLQI